MKKGLIFALAVVMVVCISVSATIAYLFVATPEVKNTFAYGDINIDLWENDYVLSSNSLDATKEVKSEADYKMIPGNTMPKNPTVTVKKDSEECWLFVKIDASENFGNFMTYGVAGGWTQGNGTDVPANVYYREVPAATADTDYKILADDQVTVLNTVTKAKLNELTESTKPTLTFTAYAVQKANVNTVAEAWALVGTQGVPANN